MVLENNTQYRANVKLSFIESIATNGLLEAKLIAAGFKNVTVTGNGTERSARGTWGLPTQEVKSIPPQLQNIQKA